MNAEAKLDERRLRHLPEETPGPGNSVWKWTGRNGRILCMDAGDF